MTSMTQQVVLSKTHQVLSEEPLLPPIIVRNPRELLGPENISLHDIRLHSPKRRRQTSPVSFSVVEVKPGAEPPTRYPLTLTWSPDKLCFHIDTEKIVNKLTVWNTCSRSIYVHICGLWDETSRLGASWRCYPRTRFLLAAGLTADMNICATPRGIYPVPKARFSLQLAASHKRDTVTGFFEVPLIVKFCNYVAPCIGENEMDESENKE